jgi:hypothetical protein
MSKEQYSHMRNSLPVSKLSSHLIRLALVVGLIALLVVGVASRSPVLADEGDTPQASAAAVTNGNFYAQPPTVGAEQVVFDWTTDKCEDEDIPDAPANAFRDAEGNVQLIATHLTGRRMIGPTLDTIARDCDPVLTSDLDPDPSNFNDSEWLIAPYTEDG